MKTILVLLALLMVIGCAAQQPKQTQSKTYSDRNKPLVDSGQMQWTDYYKGLYEAIAAEPSVETGDVLIVINDLIGMAGKYESNKISKEEFENERRIARAKLSQIDSKYTMQMQQIEASKPTPEPYVYRPYIRKSRPPMETFKAPRQTNCSSYGNQTNCTTY